MSESLYDWYDSAVTAGLNLLSKANLKENLSDYPTYRDAFSPTLSIYKSFIKDEDCPDTLKGHCQQFVEEMRKLNSLYNNSPDGYDVKIDDVEKTKKVLHDIAREYALRDIGYDIDKDIP